MKIEIRKVTEQLEGDILDHPEIAPKIQALDLDRSSAEQMVDDLQETGELSQELNEDDIAYLVLALDRLGGGRKWQRK
jgi:hypothetical protein